MGNPARDKTGLIEALGVSNNLLCELDHVIKVKTPPRCR
jgi:hypothetical protein